MLPRLASLRWFLLAAAAWGQTPPECSSETPRFEVRSEIQELQGRTWGVAVGDLNDDGHVDILGFSVGDSTVAC